jgi:hypothetical protein
MNQYLSQPSENALPKKQVQKHASKASPVFGCIWFMGQLTASVPPSNLMGISSNTTRDERITVYIEAEQGTSPNWASHTQEFLKELKNVCETEYFQDNWDGYGARAISKQACSDAERFVQMLPLYVKPPEIAPVPDGDIALEWYGKGNTVFFVTFHGDHMAEYIGTFGEGEKATGRESIEEAVPHILRYIDRISATNR